MPFERIEALRQACLQRPVTDGTSKEMRVLFAKGWVDHRREYLIEKRFTWARYEMYAGMTPTIGDRELIVGRPNHDVEISPEQMEETKRIESAMPYRCGQDSHMALDYEKLLRLGTDGVRREIENFKKTLDTVARPEDIARETFYDQCLIMLDALEIQAEHYEQEARKLAGCTADESRKQELLTIAENLRQVPKYPAKTFWQALQSVHFLIFSLQGLYQLGRPDQYLLPFYEKDLKENRISKELAQQLIDCSCLLLNEITCKSSAVGLMVGGTDNCGKPVVNELTYMYIQSIFDVRLSYPGIGLCITKQTPEDLLDLALKALAAGLTHPALFNDQLIVDGLCSYGVPLEEAHSYTHSTCVEITPIKRSSVWVASPYHNLLKPLLKLMKEKGDSLESLKDVIRAYEENLREMIRESVYDQNRQQMERSEWYTHPLVSCFVDDCLTKGADIDHDGARYQFIESSFVGMSNLIDSLLAIDYLVYREKKLTISRFYEILEDNFQNEEPLRQYIMKKLPKYGNDDPEPDQLFKRMTEWIVEEMAKYRTWHGSRFIPSMFCWIMHAEIGQHTGATPDGRLQGFPLGDGSGPAQGRELHGPTASVLSSTSWEHKRFIGGIAVNLKFSKKMFDENSLSKMRRLVQVYFDRGGFELQVNVVDREKLLDAQKHPESYQDLVVRIGGYSDYFVHLSEAMQKEVLLRTEHEL